MMVNKQIKELKRLVDSICTEYNAMCFTDITDPEDLEKTLLFIGTWVESFYYVEPMLCINDVECVEKIFDMHGEVLNLALKDEYIVNLDEKLFRKTVEKLLELHYTESILNLGFTLSSIRF
jgi:hypothetical protein